jgi:putative colanic acid biosynthesis UDP-glucose lipid carrier transferase
MIVNKNTIYISRLLGDLFLLNLSFIFSAIFAQSWEILFTRNYMFLLLIILNFTWYFFSNLSSLYDDIYLREYVNHFINLFKGTFLLVLVTIAFIFFIKENLFTRNFIFYFSVFFFFSVNIWTIVFRKFLKLIRSRGLSTRSLLVVGSEEIAEHFKTAVCDVPGFGYKFKGFVNEDDISTDKIYDFEKFLVEKKIDDVVIALSDKNYLNLELIIRICNINAIKIHLIPNYFQYLSDRFQVSSLGNLPIITARDEPLEEASRRFLKRIFDIVFSGFILIFVFSWILPIISIIIKLDSKGKIFFLQHRIGVHNKKFILIKFRTMVERDETEEFVATKPNDPRITRVGKFLRKYNIDELPQFINVLIGDMSVVGPRPHAIPYQMKYAEYFEEIKLRHSVKPGITGWAQIHGLRGDVVDEEENKVRTLQRIKYDLWYIENWSFKLDLQIILMTVWQMLSGKTNAV